MSGLYQARERLALYPSEATTIFHLLAARGFFDATSLGWSCKWCSSTRNFITKQLLWLHMSELKTTLRLSLYWNHETLRLLRERIRHHCC